MDSADWTVARGRPRGARRGRFGRGNGEAYGPASPRARKKHGGAS